MHSAAYPETYSMEKTDEWSWNNYAFHILLLLLSTIVSAKQSKKQIWPMNECLIWETDKWKQTWRKWMCKGQLNSDLRASLNMSAICCELTVSPGWSLPKHPLCGRLALTNWQISGKRASKCKFKVSLSLVCTPHMKHEIIIICHISLPSFRHENTHKIFVTSPLKTTMNKTLCFKVWISY